MNEPLTYTAKDIERYHKGEMLPAEMHRLERAALNNPMLADALEGYLFTTTAAADLQALQNRLQQRIKEEKKRRVFFVGNNWLKIAALFVLLAGGSWLVFRTLSKNNNNLATSEKSVPEHEKVGLSKANTDSSNNTLHNQNAFFNTDTGQVPDRTSIVKNDNKKVYKQYDVSTNATSATPPEKQVSNDLKYSQPQSIDKQMEVAQAPENRQSYTFRSKDERADSNAVAKREESKTVQGRISGDTIHDVNIVMKKLDGPPLNEVVLSKRKLVVGNRKMNVVVDTLEPAEGWHNFDDYVAENIKAPEELKEKRIGGGEVELSFDVDKEGNPVNITVTKSLCDRCDEEAIRILKEGPKWKTKKKKGKVTISFPLSR